MQNNNVTMAIARRDVTTKLPWLADYAEAARLVWTDKQPTAAMTDDLCLLVNPQFWASLSREPHAARWRCHDLGQHGVELT